MPGLKAGPRHPLDVRLQLDTSPKQRQLNSALWNVQQQLLSLFGVTKEALEPNYAQGKFWLHHSLNPDEGGILMVRSRVNTDLFYVNTCAWITPEAQALLVQLQNAQGMLGVEVKFVTELEMSQLLSKEAAQVQS